ncbi:MAG: hypothetical protein QXG34_04375 [Candidatus Bathyarchaeia archaeon]
MEARRSEYDTIVIINCKREQVLEIIEHLRERFSNIEITYEVFHEM